MVAWIIAGILSGIGAIILLVCIVYALLKEGNSAGALGTLILPLVILCGMSWSIVADYHNPTISHTIKDVAGYQVDTTFIVNSNRVDTLYTINYETVNKESQDYRESK